MKKTFDYQVKTELYFGQNRELEVGKILAKHNAKNVLIVIGQKSVIKSGLLNKIVKCLEAENITYFLLQGVRANPTFDLAKEGNEIVVNNGIDFILAVGGGSVIDTAKCIAVTAYYEGDIKDFNLHLAKPEKAIPVGVVLTIAAAGSEMSTSCVMQDDETGVKSGFNSELIRPVFAIENPDLSLSVNPEQTAYGVVDIMMHTLERYFCKSDEYELADELALGILKEVADVGLIAFNEPNNYEARARIMLASSLSHCGLTGIGKEFIMPVHQLEHVVSGLFTKVAHACGLAILFPGWARQYVKYDIDKFAKLGRRVFDIKNPNDKEAAMECIEKYEEYFAKLGMPNRLSQVGVKEKDVEKMVEMLTGKGSKTVYHHTHPIDEEMARTIYLSVL